MVTKQKRDREELKGYSRMYLVFSFSVSKEHFSYLTVNNVAVSAEIIVFKEEKNLHQPI